MDKVYLHVLMLIYAIPGIIILITLHYKAKVGIKVVSIILTLTLAGFYFLINKGGYKLDNYDYYFISINGLYLTFLIVAKLVMKSNEKTEKILKEEREWWKDLQSKKN